MSNLHLQFLCTAGAVAGHGAWKLRPTGQAARRSQRQAVARHNPDRFIFILFFYSVTHDLLIRTATPDGYDHVTVLRPEGAVTELDASGD
jgi:hypothetical protein